jgi:hypothetical protein
MATKTTTKNCRTNKEETLVLYLLLLATREVVLVYINIKGQYMVTGFVKPGASLEHLINTVKNETQKLSKDIISFSGEEIIIFLGHQRPIT